jgi:hypothetical protein
VCSNAAALTATQRIPDVYGALRMIATIRGSTHAAWR